MNNKLLTPILAILITFPTLLLAQKHNVVNASISLRNQELSDAKKYILGYHVLIYIHDSLGKI